MLNKGKRRPIPKPGPPGPGFVGQVVTSYVDPAELIEKYGKPIRPWRRGWRG